MRESSLVYSKYAIRLVGFVTSHNDLLSYRVYWNDGLILNNGKEYIHEGYAVLTDIFCEH